jgi:hypothetical protein
VQSSAIPGRSARPPHGERIAAGVRTRIGRIVEDREAPRSHPDFDVVERHLGGARDLAC